MNWKTHDSRYASSNWILFFFLECGGGVGVGGGWAAKSKSNFTSRLCSLQVYGSNITYDVSTDAQEPTPCPHLTKCSFFPFFILNIFFHNYGPFSMLEW